MVVMAMLVMALSINNSFASPAFDKDNENNNPFAPHDIVISDYTENVITLPHIGAVGLTVHFTVKQPGNEYTGIWFNTGNLTTGAPCKEALLFQPTTQVDCVFTLKGVKFHDYEGNSIYVNYTDLPAAEDLYGGVDVHLSTEIQRWNDWVPHKVDLTDLLMKQVPADSHLLNLEFWKKILLLFRHPDSLLKAGYSRCQPSSIVMDDVSHKLDNKLNVTIAIEGSPSIIGNPMHCYCLKP